MEWVAELDSRDLSLLFDLRQKLKIRASKFLPSFFSPADGMTSPFRDYLTTCMCSAQEAHALHFQTLLKYK